MIKKLALIIAVAALGVLLLIYPENCLNSARYGLNLWLTAVFPSLFPFMAASFLLLQTGVVRLIAHVFAPVTRTLFFAPGESAYVFIASAMSGYPLGARLTGELYASGQIDEAQAQRIVRFTSVSGPVFITGAVSTGMLGMPEAGIYLAVAHYLSAIVVGILYGCFARRQQLRANKSPNPRFADALRQFKKDAAVCPPVGELLANSVEKAIMTMLKLGGLIILFSVVLEMMLVTRIMDALSWAYSPFTSLAGLNKAGAQALLYGGVEMTSGCARAAALAGAASMKLPLISGIIAFGGLCIHMQTRAVLASGGLKLKRFGLAKTIQAMCACGLTTLLLWLFPLTTAASSITGETKTAAFGGVIFAAAALVVLLGIKIWQRSRRTALPFT